MLQLHSDLLIKQHLRKRKKRSVKPLEFPSGSWSSGLFSIFKSSPLLSCILFLFIGLITSILPMAIFIVSSKVYNRNLLQNNLFLDAWALAECIFVFWYIYIHTQYQKMQQPPTISDSKLSGIVNYLVDNVRDSSDFVRSWFFGHAPNNVSATLFFEWVSFAFYGKSKTALKLHEHLDAKQLTLFLESKLQLRLTKESQNGSVKCMKNIADTVPHFVRPFFYYIFTHILMGNFSHLFLIILGFEYQKSENIGFYIRRPKKSSKMPPIAFIHG
jgi:hypothetical protein